MFTKETPDSSAQKRPAFLFTYNHDGEDRVMEYWST